MGKRLVNILNLACIVHCAGIGIFTLASSSFLHFGYLEIGLVIINLVFGLFTILKNNLSKLHLIPLISLGAVAIVSSIAHYEHVFHGLLFALALFQIYLSYKAMNSCKNCVHHKKN